MDKATIEQKLAAIIEEEIGRDQRTVKPESRIAEDIGADSLDKLDLIMAVEHEFEISIDDDEAAKVVTVADLVKLVDEKLSEV